VVPPPAQACVVETPVSSFGAPLSNARMTRSREGAMGLTPLPSMLTPVSSVSLPLDELSIAVLAAWALPATCVELAEEMDERVVDAGGVDVEPELPPPPQAERINAAPIVRDSRKEV